MEKRVLSIINLIAILTVIVLATTSCGNSEPSDEENKFLAYSYAEKLVKEKLKSPTSAKFPGIFEKEGHVFPMGNNEFFIKSWVDSKNGLGVLIRSNFSCTIILEGNNVRVEDLVIN